MLFWQGIFLHELRWWLLKHGIFFDASFRIMESNNMYYVHSMPITVLNTLLSFNHHIKLSQKSKLNLNGKLSKFTKITEIMKPGFKFRAICLCILCAFYYSVILNVTQYDWKRNSGKINLKTLLDINTVEHLILNVISQLAHKFLILLKGAEIVDSSQGAQMNI